MITIRRSNERGHANHGWLDSYHTFSFADYYDPNNMGFSVLRVINEDRIAGGTGFATHGHRDMEIISYVVEGALEHKDTMGNSTVIRPGEIQKMSAGTGVRHSEFNHYPDKEGHFYQIWILPDKAGYEPTYAQKSIAEELDANGKVLLVSRDGRQGSLSINQDVDIHLLNLKVSEDFNFEVKDGRQIWVQVIRGAIEVNGKVAAAGDGIMVIDEKLLGFKGAKSAQLMIFDLPKIKIH